MSKIGVSGARYAIQTVDTGSTLTYSAPVLLPGIVEVDVKTAKDQATLYADNGPFDSASALGDISVDIEVADLSLEAYAALLGHTITAGVMTSNANDTAPYVALGFVGQKANGKNRWVWLLKGQFAEPDDTFKTKADKIDFQTMKLTGAFIITTKNGNWKKTTDEDAVGYVAASGATFIATVPTT